MLSACGGFTFFELPFAANPDQGIYRELWEVDDPNEV
jgi:hypothetical protein